MMRRLRFLWLLPTELLEIQWGVITLAFGLGLLWAGFGRSSGATFITMSRMGSASTWGLLFSLFGLMQVLGAVTGRPVLRVVGSHVVTGLWAVVVSIALWVNPASIGAKLFAAFAAFTWYIVVHMTYELGLDWKRTHGD